MSPSSRKRRSIDAFWWSLFGAGGTLAALFMPALLALIGIASPLGWVEAPTQEHLRPVLTHPLLRAVLFALVALSLFHWAHRFRFTLYDGLQLKHLFGLIAFLCYGGALAGSLVAALVLWHV